MTHQLQLVKFNCPIHQSWTGQKCTNLNSFDSISGEISKFHYTIPSTLTKDWIVNHPKYRHLFKGIGKFNVPPVSITLKDNVQPIQKPPRNVPLAMKHLFKEELDRMENAGIISKYGSILGSCTRVVKLICHSEKTKWITSYLLRSNRPQQAHSLTCV